MSGRGTAAFDPRALRRGIEERDLETIVALYADDAQLTLVDRDHPPAAPLVLRGRAAIAEHHRMVCNRDASHRVGGLVAAAGAAALWEECRAPDGTRLVRAALYELVDGAIARELSVQA